MKLKTGYAHSKEEVAAEREQVAATFRKLIIGLVERAVAAGLKAQGWRTGFGDDALVIHEGDPDRGVRFTIETMGRLNDRYVNVLLFARDRVSKWSLMVDNPRKVSWARLGDATPDVLFEKIGPILFRVRQAFREVDEETARRVERKSAHEAVLGFPLQTDALRVKPLDDDRYRVSIEVALTTEQVQAIREILLRKSAVAR